MGEVYRAKDTRLDPVRKQRFEREAKTISSLNHPNICTLHDIGSQDGVDYLVMESVEGDTLAKRSAARGHNSSGLRARRVLRITNLLLHFRVLCLGLLEDGDVGVGVFSERAVLASPV